MKYKRKLLGAEEVERLVREVEDFAEREGRMPSGNDTVNVFFTNRANGSAPSAQTHFHQSRKRAFAASG